MTEEPAGGRVFFSSAGRSLEEEDEIRLVSVGVDIGSSTSHLVFSRLVLERLDSRYVVSEREVLHESEVRLTPYAADGAIDAGELGRFVERQYALADLTPEAIDTGALILTGVAVQRRNARAIGELFAAQAGRLVSVSAGDGLETTLAAHGSGAVARSIRESLCVMNVDLGGGTSKIAVCEAGEVVEQTAVDVGARLVCLDEEGRVARIEAAGRRFADELGLALEVGVAPAPGALSTLAAEMAERLFELMSQPRASPFAATLLRLEPLGNARPPDVVTFSGGVAEYALGRETRHFGDLGPLLATEIRARVAAWGPRLEPPAEAIRATAIGASQYTIQVSGSTIFVDPAETLPLRNLPVVTPALPLQDDVLDPERIAAALRRSLRQLDLGAGPVALGYHFSGAATFARLDAFVRGVAAGLSGALADGKPLVLVGDGDVGGLIGIHAREERRLASPVVSIDGIRLRELEFIDIGNLLPASGAVPVVVRALVFPSPAPPAAE